MKTKLEKNTRENKTQKLKKNKVTGIEKNFKESIYQCQLSKVRYQILPKPRALNNNDVLSLMVSEYQIAYKWDKFCPVTSIASAGKI